MKTKLLLAAIAVLLTAPVFASDRGPQPAWAQRQGQGEPATRECAKTNAASGQSSVAPAAHDHAGMSGQQGKIGDICGCGSMKHAHS